MVMLYDIDSFGFAYGFITKKWQVMYEADLIQDKQLRKKIAVAQYKSWKRHNIEKLMERWDIYGGIFFGYFEKFCKRLYSMTVKKRY